ncbi:unnamed protein product, partial [Ectocarpus sp. 4 AP-2014]
STGRVPGSEHTSQGSASSQTRLHSSARPEREVVGKPPDRPQGSLVPAERGGPFDGRVGGEGE